MMQLRAAKKREIKELIKMFDETYNVKE